MDFDHVPTDGYIQTYTRTDFTNALHKTFGFRTNYEIVGKRQIKKHLKILKNKNIVNF